MFCQGCVSSSGFQHLGLLLWLQVKGTFPIPFLLFYKARVSFIISYANAGLTISEIKTLWLQTMYDAYGSGREAYISASNKNSNNGLPFPEFDQRFKQPGEKIIAFCIARDYFEKEHLYTKRIWQMTATKWLSCDNKCLQILDFGLTRHGWSSVTHYLLSLMRRKCVKLEAVQKNQVFIYWKCFATHKRQARQTGTKANNFSF